MTQSIIKTIDYANILNFKWWADRFYNGKAIGMDIRTDSVIVAYLDKSINGIHLLDYIIINTNLFKKKTEISEKFIYEIKQFIKRNKLPDHTEIILGLPRQVTILKNINIPSPDEADIKNILDFEIDRFIPTNKDDVYYDYIIINKKRNIFNILLAAVKRDIVDYFLSLLKKINLSPEVVYLSTLAAFNIYKMDKSKDTGSLILIDIDGKSLDIIMAESDSISWSKRLSVKNNEEVNNYGEIIAAELNHQKKTEQILLTGARNCLGIKDYLILKLGLKVDILNPFNKIKLPKNFDPNEGYLLSDAIGLGLRGVSNLFFNFNLISPDKKKKGKFKNYITTFILIVILFISLSISLISGYIKDIIILSKLDEELGLIKKQVADIESIGVKSENLEKHIEEFLKIQKNSTSKLKVIKELSQIIPSSIWLYSINIYNKNVELSGYANATSDLIKLMEESDFFKEVNFVGTIKKEKGIEKFRINALLE